MDDWNKINSTEGDQEDMDDWDRIGRVGDKQGCEDAEDNKKELEKEKDVSICSEMNAMV